MKILRALFSPKPTASVPAPARASVPSSVERYYAGDLQLVCGTQSVELLRQHADHPSGYVREAVLRRCVELPSPELLPTVAERLNDWVPQVQRAARTALMTLLPFVPASQLLAAMPVILRLHSPGRADYAAWLDAFEQSLIQTIAISDICTAAHGPAIKVARAAVYLLDKYGLLETSALITLILERSDDIVLAVRAVNLCACLAPELQEQFYRLAARSHFGAVRTMASRCLLAMAGHPHDEFAITALLDAQSSVRSVAMSYLHERQFDARAHYRHRLLHEHQTVRRTRVCLAALASLRNPADVELVRSFQSSLYPGVRTAARAAWFKLAEADKDEIALAALHDPAAGAGKFALQLVRKHQAYIPFATIRASLEAGGNATRLLPLVAHKRWNWLECVALLGMQRGVEEAHLLGLGEAVGMWLNSAAWYERPGKEQALFLLSAPVVAFFEHLLLRHPQRLASLLRQLEQGAAGDLKPSIYPAAS
ncbi:hypothetical protein [Duganella radicis]|uniref:HEAT repeat domain-containing protein n=1 Tax=Duganella radicis TaxID=551988 RepID=A0A6L6PSD0_9BURK|nr:hypothetical protein [Duganella radicis]MTV41762.1 hypothetical protein [Duganella radicis]